MSWSEWPISGLTEPWPQPIAADEDVWTSTGYLSTCWPGQESADNADSIPNPTTQTLYPQIITSSSPNDLSYFRPSNTPVSSAPEPQHTQPHHQTQETSSATTSQPSLSATFQPSQIPLPHSIEPPLPWSNDPKTIRASLHYSDTRNAFLIECKRRGLSYKDIKRLGGFKEAESTLRGRFRTLTKAKEQRVRKPKWHDHDIRLLCEAVSLCTDPSPSRPFRHPQQPPKVSWKKVAQYIWGHGGSYQFGNATCKKKWCEIHGVALS